MRPYEILTGRRSQTLVSRDGAQELALAGPAIRTALLTRAPPPSVESASPDAQLLAHVRAALGARVTSFDCFQLAFQHPVIP